jgi:hypothetical protein
MSMLSPNGPKFWAKGGRKLVMFVTRFWTARDRKWTRTRKLHEITVTQPVKVWHRGLDSAASDGGVAELSLFCERLLEEELADSVSAALSGIPWEANGESRLALKLYQSDKVSLRRSGVVARLYRPSFYCHSYPERILANKGISDLVSR